MKRNNEPSSGIKNCRDIRLFKGCSPIQNYNSLIENCHIVCHPRNPGVTVKRFYRLFKIQYRCPKRKWRMVGVLKGENILKIISYRFNLYKSCAQSWSDSTNIEN